MENLKTETKITPETIAQFTRQLQSEEKSAYTIEKYVRDVRAFALFAGEQELSKDLLMAYKKHLVESGQYGNASINSMLASINSFLKFIGRTDCRVANIRVQKKLYCPDEKSLSQAEYKRLKSAAKSKPRLSMILEVLFSTGIRISELKYFTVEALAQNTINVSCKNKIRTIIVPTVLRDKLLKYAQRRKIKSGVIFRTKSGKPVNRSNVWAEMKKLCEKANVCKSKVFPHNLRKLFAKMFYGRWRDIAQLADLLGHSSINTTRIYIMTTEREVRSRVEQMIQSFGKEKTQHYPHNVVQ